MSNRGRGREEMRPEHRAWGNPDLPQEDAKAKEVEEEEDDQIDEAEVPVPMVEGETGEGADEEEEVGETDDGEEGEDGMDGDGEESTGAHSAVEPYTKGGAVATANGGGAVTTANATPPEYRDITDLLNLPQIEAARRLNLPMSTLSKRWKEAVRVRKWPHRQVAKLDKEIMTLLHNIPARSEGDQVATPPEIEQALGVLLRRRQEELRPVKIRM